MKKKSLIIKGFEPNILKIPNNFLRASYKCSATTQRMYFYSIFKYISSDKNQNSLSFSFSDFFSDLNLNNLTLNMKQTDTYYLEWKWFSSDNDTKIGESINAKYKLKIEIKVAASYE